MDPVQERKQRAQNHRNQGELDQARQLYEEAAAMERESGHTLNLPHTLRHIADVARSQGMADLAEKNYAEAMALYRADPSARPLDVANALRGYALLRKDRAMWEEARELYRSHGVEAGVEECSRHIAALRA